MGVLPISMSVQHLDVWSLWRPEEGVISPKTGVTGGYEPCECWKSNSGPLEGQEVLLIAVLSLQSLIPFIIAPKEGNT